MPENLNKQCPAHPRVKYRAVISTIAQICRSSSAIPIRVKISLRLQIIARSMLTMYKYNLHVIARSMRTIYKYNLHVFARSMRTMYKYNLHVIARSTSKICDKDKMR